MKIFIRLVLNALAVMLAAEVVPGIFVKSFGTALIVVLVLAVLNLTLGFVLKVLTFPLSVVSFGFFLLVVNAIVFKVASFVKGFYVESFTAAFFGALIVTLVSLLTKKFLT